MRVINYSENSKLISGELTDKEKKIIDDVFNKANPGDKLEIELLDKKDFISEEKVRHAFKLHRDLLNSNSENFKPFDFHAINGLLDKLQKDMELK